MQREKKLLRVFGWLVVVAIVLTACISPSDLPILPTVAPKGAAPVAAAATPVPPTATPVPPTATPVPPTATPVPPTVAPKAAEAVVKPTVAPTVAPAPTAAELMYVITPDAITQSLTAPEVQKQIQVTGLDVKFTGGRVVLVAQQLKYQILTINNLQATVNVTAVNGQIKVTFDSLQPKSFMTNMIPSMVDKVIAQNTANLKVKEVKIEEGKMTIVLLP